MDVGQSTKSSYVLQELARRADVPAYLILYKPNPDYDGSQHWPHLDRIIGARIAQIWPRQERLRPINVTELGILIQRWHRNCPRCATRRSLTLDGVHALEGR